MRYSSVLIVLAALVACHPATADGFRDPAVIQAGAVVSVRAHRATALVPGLGIVEGVSVYDIGRGLPPPAAEGARLGDRAHRSSLMPPIVQAERGSTMRLAFRNDLQVKDALGQDHPSVSNLHTHGLIVSPEGLGFDGDGRAHVYGDCVFVQAADASHPPAGTKPGDPCSIGRDRPDMAAEARRVDYSYPIAVDHPSGLFWIHPHEHGQSEPQVSNGLGALLTVGSLWDYSYIGCRVSVASGVAGGETCRTQAEQVAERAREDAAQAPGGLVRVRYLALKDLQVEAGKKPGDPFRLIEFPRRPTGGSDPSAGAFGSANDARKSRCGQINLGAGLTDDLTFATPPAHPGTDFGHGQCWASDDTKAQRWVFTVSGQVYPAITLRPGGVEVWRLANTSADVTYRLHLETMDETPSRRLAFTVRSLDGVATPTESTTTEIVLMPSARIEVLVARCRQGEERTHCADPAATVKARLRTAGVATGISTPPDPAAPRDGDQWPPIDLATVTFDAAPGGVAASQMVLKSIVATTAATLPARAVPATAAALSETAPAPSQPAAGLSTACDWSSYVADAQAFPPDGDLVRLVRFNNTDFGDGNGGELFGIHVENRHLASVAGAKVTVGDLVRDGATAPAGGTRSLIAQVSLADPCHDVPGGLAAGDFAKFYPAFSMDGPPNVTARHGGTEFWLVVNDSRECHNFHIHQMKFTVVDADVVVGSGSDPTSQDQCLGDRKLTPPIAQSALHDNYPIPPGARVLFRFTLDGPKLGRFVFHCHILEHEDKGMMATIDVVPPTDTGAGARTGLIDRWWSILLGRRQVATETASEGSGFLPGPVCRSSGL